LNSENEVTEGTNSKSGSNNNGNRKNGHYNRSNNNTSRLIFLHANTKKHNTQILGALDGINIGIVSSSAPLTKSIF
jgi:hypothetical protein